MHVQVVVVVGLRDQAAGADDLSVLGAVLQVHLPNNLCKDLIDVDPVLGAGLHERAAPNLSQSLETGQKSLRSVLSTMFEIKHIKY